MAIMPWLKGLGGALLVLVGLVWFGQGIGLPLGRSFMIGRPEWAVAGLLCVLLGAWLLRSALQPRFRNAPTGNRRKPEP